MREEPGRLSSAIHALSKEIGRPLKLMEVCGTHTVAIFRHGVRSLLPEGIRLLSGPGCPVCVTSIHDVDTAAALAKTPGVVLATFGDMMRVPGGEASLNDARADGADVRVVYSPLDALTLAAENPQMQVVFFATGFETTSPLVAGTLMEADARGVKNFSIYPSHKLVPPALRALLSSGEVEIDGFILPGHVCTISGREPYDFVASEFGTPGVITGFDAADILEGILMLLTRVRSGEPAVEIQYRKVVREEGNPRAREVTGRCLRPTDAYWRGIGTIPESGLTLTDEYAHRDVRMAVGVPDVAEHPEPKGCSCGEVLRGVKIPTECPLFGKGCTPERPVGACMVSTEGSCAAYYRYGGER
jgi:hydrogenase expression/formation protein HypD